MVFSSDLRIRLPLIIASLALAGCGGGGSNAIRPSAPGDPPVLVQPVSLAFTAVGQQQNFTATETQYTNPFTATSSNSAVATVSPGTYYSTFVVTAVAAGTATITVKDTNGHSATVSVGVTTTTGGVN